MKTDKTCPNCQSNLHSIEPNPHNVLTCIKDGCFYAGNGTGEVNVIKEINITYYCPNDKTKLKDDNKYLSSCPKCNFTKRFQRQDFTIENNTFAETIGIIEDLKNEFILLESIRQTAKEYDEMFFEYQGESGQVKFKPKDEFSNEQLYNKFAELRHLVNTD